MTGRGLRAWTIALFVSVVGVVLFQGVAAAQVGTSSISGTITNGTGDGLPGICVDASTIDSADPVAFPEPVSFTQTDENGDYEVPDLDDGVAYIILFSDGCGGDGTYKTEWYTQGATNDPLINFQSFRDFETGTLLAAEVTAPATGINETLSAGSKIEGTVTDGTTPIANIAVNAFSVINVSEDPAAWPQWEGWGESGSDGTYAVGGLNEGSSYLVYFEDYNGLYRSEWYTSGPTNVYGFHNFKTGTDLAATSVTAPATGKNEALETGSKLSGTVSGGTGLDNVCANAFTLESGSDTWPEWAGWGCADADGDYSISGLESGTQYIVLFNDWIEGAYKEEWYTSSDDTNVNVFGFMNFRDWDDGFTSGTLQATEVAGDATDIDEALNTGSKITGTLSATGDPDMSDVCVDAFTVAAGDDSWPQWQGWGCANEDGDYSITGLSASTNYIVYFNDYSGTFRTEWYSSDDTDVNAFWNFRDWETGELAASLAQVPASGDAENIDEELSAGASMSGDLSGTADSTLGDICVEVFTIDTSTEDTWPTYLASDCDVSTTDGTWSVGGLDETATNHIVLFYDGSGTYKEEWYRSDATDVIGYHNFRDWDDGWTSGTLLASQVGGDDTGINEDLSAGKKISGDLDGTGGDLEDVCADAFTVDSSNSFDNGSWPEWQGWGCADSTGAYEITGLADGSNYIVLFNDWFAGAFKQEWYTTGTEAFGFHNFRDWNDDFTSGALNATVVDISVSSATNIDEDLSAGAKIEGTVTGTNVFNVCADAFSLASLDDWPVWEGWGCVDEDGAFAVSGLDDGSDYIVLFNDWVTGDIKQEWYKSGASALTGFMNYATATEVTADDTSPPEITEDLSAGKTISGNVTVSGGANFDEDANICLYAWKASNGDWAGWACVGAPPNATTTSMAYEINGLDDTSYKVQLFDYSATYAATWFSGDSTFDAADEINVSASNATGKNFALSTGGKIQGTVYESDGTTTFGEGEVCVYAFDASVQDVAGLDEFDDPIPADTADAYVNGDCTASNGTFSIEGLPDDDYRLKIDDYDATAYVTEWFDGVESGNATNSADFDEAVTAGAGGKVTISGANTVTGRDTVLADEIL